MRRNYVILGAVFMAALIGGCKKEKEPEKVVVKGKGGDGQCGDIRGVCWTNPG